MSPAPRVAALRWDRSPATGGPSHPCWTPPPQHDALVPTEQVGHPPPRGEVLPREQPGIFPSLGMEGTRLHPTWCLGTPCLTEQAGTLSPSGGNHFPGAMGCSPDSSLGFPPSACGTPSQSRWVSPLSSEECAPQGREHPHRGNRSTFTDKGSTRKTQDREEAARSESARSREGRGKSSEQEGIPQSMMGASHTRCSSPQSQSPNSRGARYLLRASRIWRALHSSITQSTS